MAETAKRQVSIFIDGKQAEVTLKSLTSEQRKLNNELANTALGTEEYEQKVTRLQSINAIIDEHKQKVRGVKQAYGLISAGVGDLIGLAAGAFTVDTIIGYGKQLFNTGVQMDSLVKKAKVVFGDTLPLITAEAEQNAAAMGLTNQQYIAAAANIQDLLVPMGFQRDEAAGISGQLVNLSGALSEWTGGQIKATEVANILQDAVLGEREELKQLGISISQADVDARVAAKGLGELTGAALQQAEAAATLELILEKSTDAQAAFANGSGSLVRQQAEAAAKFQEISEKLATALLPVFDKLLGLALSLANGLGAVASGIESLLDPAGAATEAFDAQAATVNDLTKNVEPLLGRYDELSTKSNLSAKEQDELQKIITTVSNVVPSAVTQFDEYGRALGLNTDKAREFIEVEKARLRFINKEASDAVAKQIRDLEELAKVEKARLDRGTKFAPAQLGQIGSSEVKLTDNEIQEATKNLSEYQQQIQGARAELARLNGENLKAPEPPKAPDPPKGTSSGGTSEDKQTGSGNNRVKEAEAVEQELLRLIKKTTDLKNQLLDKANEDELQAGIKAIEKRYEEQIKVALSLEEKGVAAAKEQRLILEQLKSEEIAKFSKDFAQKATIEEWKAKAEAEQAGYEFLAQRQKEREDAENQINEFKAFDDELKKELELQNLQEQYTKLLALADNYFNSELDIRKAYEERKKQITDKYDKEAFETKKQYDQKLIEAEKDLQIAKVEAFQQGAAVLQGLVEEGTLLSKGLFLFEKAAAAVSVILNLQKEKAAIFAAARVSTVFDPTGIAALAIAAPQVARANIRAGISLATIAATSIAPFIRQKYEGGFLKVRGQTDKRTYNALPIAPPDTGLLPGSPVLFRSKATGEPVLASERGTEYFVSAHDMQKPYVANLVRMIDLATKAGRGVSQFAEGGTNGAIVQTSPTPSPPGPDMAVLVQLQATLAQLVTLLNTGIVAVVPDNTVIGIRDRLVTLNEISGGYYS